MKYSMIMSSKSKCRGIMLTDRGGSTDWSQGKTMEPCCLLDLTLSRALRFHSSELRHQHHEQCLLMSSKESRHVDARACSGSLNARWLLLGVSHATA